MFSSLFTKETSHDLELFLNTFNIFAQKKSQLNALLKSLSSLKSPNDDEEIESQVPIAPVVTTTTTTESNNKETLAELSNQVWSALLSQMDDEAGVNDDQDDAAPLSALLQRCQSSLDEVAHGVIMKQQQRDERKQEMMGVGDDSVMLHEMDDNEEDQEGDGEDHHQDEEDEYMRATAAAVAAVTGNNSKLFYF
jgi:hypothetical protein